MTPIAKKRILTLSLLTLATTAAGAAIIFWATSPLNGFYFGSTDAEIIRQCWPHRLTQPNWTSASGNMLFDWSMTEARVRLSVVASAWAATGAAILYAHLRRRQPET
jgi:hypothetical protein